MKSKIGSISERQMEAQRKKILSLSLGTRVGAVGSLPPGSIEHEAAAASEKRIREILSSDFWYNRNGRTPQMMGQCIEFALRLKATGRKLSPETQYRLRFFTPGTRECERAVRYSLVMVENVMDHPEYQENATAWNWLRDEMGNVLLGDDYTKDIGRPYEIIDGLEIAYYSLLSAFQDTSDLLPMKKRPPQPSGWEDMVRRVRSRKGFWGSMYPKGYSYYAELAHAATFYLETGDVKEDAADDNDFEAEVSGRQVGASKVAGASERSFMSTSVRKFSDLLPKKEATQFLVQCIREMLPVYEKDHPRWSQFHDRLRRALDYVDAAISGSSNSIGDGIVTASNIAQGVKWAPSGSIVNPQTYEAYIADAIIDLCTQLRELNLGGKVRLQSTEVLDQLEYAAIFRRRDREALLKKQWKFLLPYIERRAGDLLTSGFPSTLPRLEGTPQERASAVLIQDSLHDFTEWLETGAETDSDFDIVNRIRDGFQEITVAKTWIEAYTIRTDPDQTRNVWRLAVFSCCPRVYEPWMLETAWQNLRPIPLDEIGKKKRRSLAVIGASEDWNDPSIDPEKLMALAKKNPKAYTNPNMPLSRLRTAARSYPWFVEQNPALPILFLEEPQQAIAINRVLVTAWEVAGLNALSEKSRRLYAADCAARVLPNFENHYGYDKGPRRAIESARLFANGKIGRADLAMAYNEALLASQNSVLSVAKYAAGAAAQAASFNSEREERAAKAAIASVEATILASWPETSGKITQLSEAEKAWQLDRIRHYYWLDHPEDKLTEVVGGVEASGYLQQMKIRAEKLSAMYKKMKGTRGLPFVWACKDIYEKQKGEKLWREFFQMAGCIFDDLSTGVNQLDTLAKKYSAGLKKISALKMFENIVPPPRNYDEYQGDDFDVYIGAMDYAVWGLDAMLRQEVTDIQLLMYFCPWDDILTIPLGEILTKLITELKGGYTTKSFVPASDLKYLHTHWNELLLSGTVKGIVGRSEIQRIANLPARLKSKPNPSKKKARVGEYFTTIQTERSTFDVLKNPSFSELDKELKLKKGRPVRGLVLGDDIYFWDAHSATHAHVTDHMKLQLKDVVCIELVPTNAATGFLGDLPPRQPTYEGFSIDVDYARGWPWIQWETHPYFAARPNIFTKQKVTKRERWGDRTPPLPWSEVSLYRALAEKYPRATPEELVMKLRNPESHIGRRTRKR